MRLSALLPALAAALASLAFALPAAAQAPGDVVINEILYDPPAPQPSTNEYVELFNRSASPVDLAGLALADAADTTFLPASAPPLAPGAYVVLVRNGEAFAEAFPGVTNAVEVPGFPALNNSGDDLRLLVQADNAVLDFVPYRTSWGGADVALERISPDGPSDDPANFASSTDPAGGTPGQPNSVLVTDEEPPVIESAEAASATLIVVRFSETVVNAGDAARYNISGVGTPSAVIDLAVGPPRATLQFLAPLAEGLYTVTATGLEDEAGNVQPQTSATFFVGDLGTPQPGDLVINEILYDPPAPQPSTNEYVEVLNRTAQTFDLGALRLADAADTVSVAMGVTPLGPGGYAVLVRDREAFAAAFPDVPAEAVVLEVDGFPSLNNGGDTVRLLRSDDAPLDAVPYAPSWGGSDASLEKIDPDGPSDSPANFASSVDPRGGTPGEQNSVFAIDTAPPALDAADALGASTVAALFTEPVDQASASDPANYRIETEAGESGPAVVSASVDADDPARVVLGLAAPLGGPATFTLVATNIADLTGNVQAETRAAFFFGQGAVPAPGDIVINEILYDPPSPQPSSNEYVELFNRSGKIFLLREFSLADNADTVAVGAGTLAPGGYAVLVRNPDAFAEAFPDAPGPDPRGRRLPDAQQLRRDGAPALYSEWRRAR